MSRLAPSMPHHTSRLIWVCFGVAGSERHDHMCRPTSLLNTLAMGRLSPFRPKGTTLPWQWDHIGQRPAEVVPCCCHLIADHLEPVLLLSQSNMHPLWPDLISGKQLQISLTHMQQKYACPDTFTVHVAKGALRACNHMPIRQNYIAWDRA